MKIIDDNHSLRTWRAQLSSENLKVAYVATMGGLHGGHRALINKAKSLADRVIVSIYLNPLQFDDKSDYDNYPQQIDSDIKFLKSSNIDILWLPKAQDLQINTDLDSNNTPSTDFSIKINQKSILTDGLCAANRCGHFEGVCTVIVKLFNLVQADFGVFGKKDFQQLVIIKSLVDKFHLNIAIIGVDIVRNNDGVAYSTRLKRLSKEGYDYAKKIYPMLLQLKNLVFEQLFVKKDHEKLLENLTEYVENKVSDNFLVKLQYLEIRNLENLGVYALNNNTHSFCCDHDSNNNLEKYGLFICVSIENVRLIDHIKLDKL